MAISSGGYLKKQTECELSYEWVIKDFSKCYKRGSYSPYTINSPTFPLNQGKSFWIFQIIIKKESCSEYTTLDLNLVFKKIENKDELIKNQNFCTIQIENRQPQKVLLSNLIFGESQWKCKVFSQLSFRSLVNELPDDTLHIVCNLNIYNPVPHPKIGIIVDLKNSLDNKKNSDITFIVGDQQLKAHKFILQCRSVVFEAMLDVDMLEKHTNQIEIPDVRPEIFEKMLEFIYTDDVERKLTVEDASDLLDLAEKYQLKNLKQLCGMALYGLISNSNALDFYLIFEKYALKELLNQAKKYIENAKQEVMKAKNFQYYLENPEALKLLLELF